MKMTNKKNITVLGSGSFGTAVANLLAIEGHKLTLWGRDADVIAEINEKRTNSRYVPGQTLEDLQGTIDLTTALQGAEVVVLAVPSQAMRQVLELCRPKAEPHACWVNLAKGIEQNTLKLPHQVFADVMGEDDLESYVALSGPTFSKELIDRTPTAAVLAGFDDKVTLELQQALSLQWFRLYRSQDVLGVELGGAFKNVVAIAVGVLEGLGFGANSRASFMTRCLAEMTRLGEALGADPRTFSGLSGLGDLILTCTGDLSRNRQVGLRLGQGESLDAILSDMSSVAEGVTTAKSLHQLQAHLKAAQRDVDLPNATQVYKILYENLSPRQAVMELLERDLKSEY